MCVCAFEISSNTNPRERAHTHIRRRAYTTTNTNTTHHHTTICTRICGFAVRGGRHLYARARFARRLARRSRASFERTAVRLAVDQSALPMTRAAANRRSAMTRALFLDRVNKRARRTSVAVSQRTELVLAVSLVLHREPCASSSKRRGVLDTEIYAAR